MSQQWNQLPPIQYPSYVSAGPNKATDGAAIVAFILSLSSFVFWFAPAIVALGLAPSAKRRIKANSEYRRGTGLAVASQVISIVSLLVGVLVLLGMAFG